MSDNKVWEYKSNENDKLAEKVAKDKNIVMTKPEMARYLISCIDFVEGEKVLDPCLGEGAFYENLPQNVIKDWCEINKGKDFMNYFEECDVVISNPPFVPRKLFWEFNEKAMRVARRKIYWLINMASLNVFTPKRLEFMKDHKWFIQSLNIVNDKRWYGRYCMIEIGKEDKKTFQWKRESF